MLSSLFHLSFRKKKRFELDKENCLQGYEQIIIFVETYRTLSASPTHLLLEVGWLTKLLYIVKFDFGSFQRLQFL